MGPTVTTELWWWGHAGATWAMVGLIWVVQRVIYPMMAQQPAGGFDRWHQDYTRRLGPVVAPLMLVESVGGLWWVIVDSGSGWAWAGAALVAVNVISTAGVQVPIHRRLAHGFDGDQIRRLVATNWVRTVAWTARGGLLLLVAVA